MQKFNLKELVAHLQEQSRSLDIADNVAVIYQGNFTPIKINGVIKEELKVFKGSFCIYYEKEQANLNDYDINIELLVLEEYSDSPYSIYIDETGFVNGDEYGEIHTIEIGDIITLKVEDCFVTDYEVEEL